MSESFSVSSKIRDNYNVYFIDELPSFLSKHPRETTIFVIDKLIAETFSDQLSDLIANSRCVFIEAHERNKTVDYSLQVIRDLIGLSVRKNDSLVAIGGGITQDITTFIASILFRGLDWKFYPTTLLAQCDSCIGSKSSINFDHYKNLLGTFNPPSEIFIYNGFLDTLTESEVRSGIGEMLHYFFSEGIDLANEVGARFNELINDRSVLPYFIKNSLRIKKNIIQIDEFDTSIRHIFNYGHTFGHALEAITDYQIPHGQAISIGMDLANYISLQKGMINNSQFDEMHHILVKNIPPFKFTEEVIPSYFDSLSKDKKNKGNKLGCILCNGPGKLEKVFIDIDDNLKKMVLEYSGLYSI